MITIRKLAAEFGLSRSTLLYYDSIGLLKPSTRSEAGYRQYSKEDRKRLEQICTYRQMGLQLKEINQLLNLSGNEPVKILENQLIQLSKKISTLRKQQYAILNILQNKNIQIKAGVIDKEAWINILRGSGLSDEDMKKWHLEFEKISPQGHHDFLVALGFNDHRIREIRNGRID